jgi:hypothetical protein
VKAHGFSKVDEPDRQELSFVDMRGRQFLWHSWRGERGGRGGLAVMWSPNSVISFGPVTSLRHEYYICRYVGMYIPT